MLIDLHAHTSGISRCCRADAREVAEAAKNAGLDGVVITNHYPKYYLTDKTPEEFAAAYIKEYHYAEECGREVGIKVFQGLEVSMELYPSVHILLYGVSDDFILNNTAMFDYTQKQLYEKVKEYGGAMVQAHPFRGTTVIDTEYLDGIEINCHPVYKNSHSDEILEIAAKNKLSVTCGGDFHADSYRPKCGMYLPSDTENTFDLSKYILTAEKVHLCVQEPENAEIRDIYYGKI